MSFRHVIVDQARCLAHGQVYITFHRLCYSILYSRVSLWECFIPLSWSLPLTFITGQVGWPTVNLHRGNNSWDHILTLEKWARETDEKEHLTTSITYRFNGKCATVRFSWFRLCFMRNERILKLKIKNLKEANHKQFIPLLLNSPVRVHYLY